MASVDLQSEDHRNLLDIIDELRSLGINRYIDLPQIIVCGDQSAGKSSVLEAISGLSFPTKDNLCTRFATELVLRRDETPGVKVSIIPAPDASKQDAALLSQFQHDIDYDKPDLAGVIEQAKKAMQLSETKVFSSDILRIELKGPQQPHLTLVDLPGLFRASNRDQSVDSAAKVHDMIRSYLQKPRSIILAVVSAQSDSSLQPITELSKEFDRTGSRTLGLITKPDTLPRGSDSEASYLALAQNKDIIFRLGWHVLRNRSYETRKATSAQRDQDEKDFFATGPWAHLDRTIVGIQALRTRLSNVLKNEILTNLPSLTKDVSSGIIDCENRLNTLGTPRTTLVEQKRYLRQVSRAFSDLMQAAVDAHYGNSFFGQASTEIGYKKRFRSIVQNELEQFARNMRLRGKQQVICDASATNEEQSAYGSQWITRDHYVDHVKSIMRRSRGCELPGALNSAVVAELFRDQCRPWPWIIEEACETVFRAARLTTRLILEHIAVPETVDALQTHLDEGMDSLVRDVLITKDRLLEPHLAGHPITYSPALGKTVVKLQQDRDDNPFRKAVGDLETFAAELAVDYMQAYYKVALGRVIDDISVLAIEQQMNRYLPTLLSADRVDDLTDEEVSSIAGESEVTVADREHYMDKLAALQNAKLELRRLDRFQADSADKIVSSLANLEVDAGSKAGSTPSRTNSEDPSPKLASTPVPVVQQSIFGTTNQRSPFTFGPPSKPPLVSEISLFGTGIDAGQKLNSSSKGHKESPFASFANRSQQ